MAPVVSAAALTPPAASAEAPTTPIGLGGVAGELPAGEPPAPDGLSAAPPASDRPSGARESFRLPASQGFPFAPSATALAARVEGPPRTPAFRPAGASASSKSMSSMRCPSLNANPMAATMSMMARAKNTWICPANRGATVCPSELPTHSAIQPTEKTRWGATGVFFAHRARTVHIITSAVMFA